MLMVTYNLNNHDDDYDALFDEIESLGPTWHDGAVLDSVWWVKTDFSPDEVTERLQAVTDTDDMFVVIDVTTSATQGWMPQDFWDWCDQ